MQTISRLLSLATTGKKLCLYIFLNFQGHFNNKEEWVQPGDVRAVFSAENRDGSGGGRDRIMADKMEKITREILKGEREERDKVMSATLFVVEATVAVASQWAPQGRALKSTEADQTRPLYDGSKVYRAPLRG